MSRALFILANLAGLLGFLYPFLLPVAGITAPARPDAPVIFFALTALCLLVVIADLAVRELDARTVALMGVLAALNAALRLAETTILVLPGGFSPVFLLIILTGYLFRARFGFLFGTLSLLVSAVVTGGIGPWLPYQMTAAGWVGLGAGLLPHPERRWLRIALLAAYGGVWGLGFGLLLNLYFWPFIAGTAGGWEAGLSLGETLRRYLVFYGLSSLWWDAFRAVGNIVLLGVLADPLLKVLGRFRRRTVVVWREPSAARLADF
ncbi:MAG TPA: ECF transporter S component [Chloroflexi bacterium]|nr:ECF transporter S component [Chloroflexota bacterium]